MGSRAIWLFQWAWLGLLCLLSFFSPDTFAQPQQCDKVIITDDSDYGPVHWYDGTRLRGASIDIVTTALDAIHVPYVVRFVGPLERVLQAGKDGEVDIISSLRPTPERARFLEFSKVPVLSNSPTIFVAKDRAFSYTRWTDLIGKKGGHHGWQSVWWRL